MLCIHLCFVLSCIHENPIYFKVHLVSLIKIVFVPCSQEKVHLIVKKTDLCRLDLYMTLNFNYLLIFIMYTSCDEAVCLDFLCGNFLGVNTSSLLSPSSLNCGPPSDITAWLSSAVP